jgi:hypothetical protein
MVNVRNLPQHPAAPLSGPLPQHNTQAKKQKGGNNSNNGGANNNVNKGGNPQQGGGQQQQGKRAETSVQGLPNGRVQAV